MMSHTEEKDTFLESLKSEGFSSPAGQQWEKFRKLLVTAAEGKGGVKSKLKNPLILGGSIANDAEKHERLSEQLDWAIEHGCFDEAMDYLKNLSKEQWNYCDPEEWNDIHSWRKGDW